MTPHINAKKEEIAKVVLMPGDPLRAKFIAEKYLKNAKLVNTVRNMLMFTGEYNGKKVTIAGSGMGQPSIGIYSYELFKFYDVDKIIRIGSSGSYREDLGIHEIFLADESYSDSTTFSEFVLGEKTHLQYPSKKLNDALAASAKKLNIPLRRGRIHSSDVFYAQDPSLKLKTGADCCEMESYALFTNAKKLNKEAATIVTIVDNLVTKVEISAEEREKNLTKMVEIALGIL